MNGEPDELLRIRERSSDVETALASMSRLWGSPMYLAADPPSRFDYRAEGASDGTLGIARAAYTGTCTSGAGEYRTMALAYAASGRHRWRVANEEGDGSRPFLVAPGRPLDVSFDGLDLITVNIDPVAFERSIASLAGSDGPLRWDGANGRMTNAGHLRATMLHLDAVLRQLDGGMENALIRATSLHIAIAAIASSFRLVDPAPEPPGGAGTTAAVRRALAYIDDHAADPITVEDIAGAARLSVRAVQYAFRRELGRTPSEELRRARMAGAHRDLVAGDPTTTTVAAIARRWGFTHPGRFASAYRLAFGRSPGSALRG